MRVISAWIDMPSAWRSSSSSAWSVAGAAALARRSPSLLRLRVPARRSLTSPSLSSISNSTPGCTCLGSTPTAPRARAWPTYTSPSLAVYIITGIIAVRGSALMADTASKPSMPGML